MIETPHHCLRDSESECFLLWVWGGRDSLAAVGGAFLPCGVPAKALCPVLSGVVPCPLRAPLLPGAGPCSWRAVAVCVCRVLLYVLLAGLLTACLCAVPGQSIAVSHPLVAFTDLLSSIRKGSRSHARVRSRTELCRLASWISRPT